MDKILELTEEELMEYLKMLPENMIVTIESEKADQEEGGTDGRTQ